MKPAPIACVLAMLCLAAAADRAAAESNAIDKAGARRSANLFTTTNVNLRSGPGTNHAKRGVIPVSQIVTVLGCIDGYRWCRVEWSGRRGWIYARTLTRPGLGNLFASYAQGVGIPVIAFEPEVKAAPAAADTGAQPGAPASGGAAGAPAATSFHVKSNDDLMGADIGLPQGFGR